MKYTNQSNAVILRKSRCPLYPGAADDRYFAEKALNILTAIVSGMGFVSALLFLLTLN